MFIIYSIVIGSPIEWMGVRPSFRLTGELPGTATQLAQYICAKRWLANYYKNENWFA